MKFIFAFAGASVLVQRIYLSRYRAAARDARVNAAATASTVLTARVVITTCDHRRPLLAIS